jgi:hypothetical protein
LVVAPLHTEEVCQPDLEPAAISLTKQTVARFIKGFTVFLQVHTNKRAVGQISHGPFFVFGD